MRQYALGEHHYALKERQYALVKCHCALSNIKCIDALKMFSGKTLGQVEPSGRIAPVGPHSASWAA